MWYCYCIWSRLLLYFVCYVVIVLLIVLVSYFRGAFENHAHVENGEWADVRSCKWYVIQTKITFYHFGWRQLCHICELKILLHDPHNNLKLTYYLWLPSPFSTLITIQVIAIFDFLCHFYSQLHIVLMAPAHYAAR